MKNTILLLAAMAIFSACTKQPTANFTTDKQNYTGGETITLTNQSTDADHYLWNISDGQTASSINLTYNTSLTTSGELSFTLSAYSANDKKVDFMTKTVNITPTAGSATFWIENGYITTVTIAEISKQITYSYASTPECGSEGCANFTLYSGTYNYYATTGSYYWSGSITVSAGNCSTMKLNINKAGVKEQYQQKPLLGSY